MRNVTAGDHEVVDPGVNVEQLLECCDACTPSGWQAERLSEPMGGACGLGAKECDTANLNAEGKTVDSGSGNLLTEGVWAVWPTLRQVS